MSAKVNELIQKVFKDFQIPVYSRYYGGNKTPYIIFFQTQTVLTRCSYEYDKLENYSELYDFHFYSKEDLYTIMQQVTQILEENGFRRVPSRDSGDLYEPDTGIYHNVLCFEIIPNLIKEDEEDDEDEEDEDEDN